MFLALLSCAPQVDEPVEFEAGALSILLEESEATEVQDFHQKLRQAFPEAQFKSTDTVQWSRQFLLNLPSHIPDVMVAQSKGQIVLTTPATAQEIEVADLIDPQIQELTDEINRELEVPIRKQRMTLLSTVTEANLQGQASLNVYVGARLRAIEEQLNQHPAIQLTYGGGVHTNIMLDKHVGLDSWEKLMDTHIDWTCRPLQGGQSASFYACEIPDYSDSCMGPTVKTIRKMKRLMTTLQEVSLPTALTQSRTPEAQAELDSIFIQLLKFKTEQPICLSTGCYLCSDICQPTLEPTSYQSLSPFDAAWRFCTQGQGGKGIVCGQLRFDEVDMPPVVSLHDDPCIQK